MTTNLNRPALRSGKLRATELDSREGYARVDTTVVSIEEARRVRDEERALVYRSRRTLHEAYGPHAVLTVERESSLTHLEPLLDAFERFWWAAAAFSIVCGVAVGALVRWSN